MKLFRIHRPRAVTLLLVVGMVASAIYLSWLGLAKAHVFDWYSTDLGNMWETIWHVAHGQGFVFHVDGNLVSRLAYHADYILILLAPLAWIWRDASPLLIVQAIAVSAGAWFIFSIARTWLKSERLALAFGLGWLLYGPIVYPSLWQFHAVTLAPTLMLACAEALIQKRSAGWEWLWAILAILTKEQTGLILGGLMWMVGRKWGNRKMGGSILVVGGIFTALNFLMFIPQASLTGAHFVWNFYFGDLGPTTASRFSAFTSWQTWLNRLRAVPIVQNLLMLLAPFGFLPLLNGWWVIGILVMLPHWLSRVPEAQTVFYQNHVLSLPFFWLGAIQGLSTVQRWIGHRIASEKILSWCLLGLAFFCSGLFSPFPWSLRWNSAWLTHDPELTQLTHQISRLPSSTHLAYTLGLGRASRSFTFSSLMPFSIIQTDTYAVYEIPTFANSEQIGGEEWRLFNQRALMYFRQTSSVQVVRSWSHGGIFQAVSPLAQRQIAQDIQRIYVSTLQDVMARHGM